MILVQITTSLNSGSVGRIAEDLGQAAILDGHKSYIAAAYTDRPSASNVIKIGNDIDRLYHGLKTRLIDRHGFGSALATKKLIKELQLLKPDIIHLHTVHGYYLNIKILFEYLKMCQVPLVWTQHDCWSFTGHCTYFDKYNCYKWEKQCFNCPNKRGYPASWFFDNSFKNYNDKIDIFRGLGNIVLISPSQWLADHLGHSFLSSYPVQVIPNGIDVNTFKPSDRAESLRRKYGLNKRLVLLGVASKWDERKGLNDFKKLSEMIDNRLQIVLVGVNKAQVKSLPDNIIGIERTEDIGELVALYSLSEVFINPTYTDNFPTTNLEALACGTPVITYDTGGSPEAITKDTGTVIERGDVSGLYKAILNILGQDKEKFAIHCRMRAETHFNRALFYQNYSTLYKLLIDKK